MKIEFQRSEFIISTDPSKLDIDIIHNYLSSQSYWAKGRPRDVVEKSIKNSLNFGVYENDLQVGFARVVTDSVTFAWLCDVFILESHQGHGLGKWLVECVVSHPDMEKVKYIVLATSNAHDLYRKYGGFEAIRFPDRMMIRYRDLSP
jgi:GNAT superfamily N-acetyltransferase